MKDYNLVQFIEELLIPDLEKMITQQLHYYAFSIICQAIEVMGAATDQNDLGDPGLSEQRFTNSLARYFKDLRYGHNQRKFFTMLRGPLIHQLRPGDAFFLASEAKDSIDPRRHLTTHESGSTVLIIEPFLSDFKLAFKRFKSEVQKDGAQAPARFAETFLIVSPLSLEYGKTIWDPRIAQNVTITASATASSYLPFVPMEPDAERPASEQTNILLNWTERLDSYRI